MKKYDSRKIENNHPAVILVAFDDPSLASAAAILLKGRH
jgi:hypothetical protein